MLLRHTRSDAYAIAGSAAIAIGGVLAIRSGDNVGWWILAAFICTAAVYLARPWFLSEERVRDDESIDISSWGVRRSGENGLRESVAWNDLTEVAVLTTAGGSFTEDVFIVMRGLGNDGVVVPHTLAVESGVLTELQSRLPDFDNETFVSALQCKRDDVFVVWRASGPNLLNIAPPVTKITPTYAPWMRAG
jgi:hypothetical protein